MNPKIQLLIKADTFTQAKTAAAKRGIHISDLCALNKNEFRARTDMRNVIPVQKWFAEDGKITPGFGYDPGTLLFFKLED